MKVSDLIADLVSKETKHIFCGNGGWVTNLLFSFDKVVKLIPVANEQAASFAADAYSRLTGFGCCIATAGPGMINLLSGVFGAHYDGVGMLVIVGADTTDRLKTDIGIKQGGFQEMPIKKMFGSELIVINMYDKNKVCWQLLSAIEQVKQNKVVILNIPDDVQRAEVTIPTYELLHEEIANAERPVFVIGQGVKRAKAVEECLAYIDNMKQRYPKAVFIPTWGTINILPDAPRFGQCGSKEGNSIVDGADLVVCIGSRLDSHHIGKDFFKNKKVIYVGDCLNDDTSNAYMVCNWDLNTYFYKTIRDNKHYSTSVDINGERLAANLLFGNTFTYSGFNKKNAKELTKYVSKRFKEMATNEHF